MKSEYAKPSLNLLNKSELYYIPRQKNSLKESDNSLQDQNPQLIY